MNVANLSPPGCVDVEFVPGDTANVTALGPLTITIPLPPAPELVSPGSLDPPPPPPVLAVPG